MAEVVQVSRDSLFSYPSLNFSPASTPSNSIYIPSSFIHSHSPFKLESNNMHSINNENSNYNKTNIASTVTYTTITPLNSSVQSTMFSAIFPSSMSSINASTTTPPPPISKSIYHPSLPKWPITSENINLNARISVPDINTNCCSLTGISSPVGTADNNARYLTLSSNIIRTTSAPPAHSFNTQAVPVQFQEHNQFQTQPSTPTSAIIADLFKEPLLLPKSSNLPFLTNGITTKINLNNYTKKIQLRSSDGNKEEISIPPVKQVMLPSHLSSMNKHLYSDTPSPTKQHRRLIGVIGSSPLLTREDPNDYKEVNLPFNKTITRAKTYSFSPSKSLSFSSSSVSNISTSTSSLSISLNHNSDSSDSTPQSAPDQELTPPSCQTSSMTPLPSQLLSLRLLQTSLQNSIQDKENTELLRLPELSAAPPSMSPDHAASSSNYSHLALKSISMSAADRYSPDLPDSADPTPILLSITDAITNLDISNAIQSLLLLSMQVAGADDVKLWKLNHQEWSLLTQSSHQSSNETPPLSLLTVVNQLRDWVQLTYKDLNTYPFNADPYYTLNNINSILALPIRINSNITGILVLTKNIGEIKVSSRMNRAIINNISYHIFSLIEKKLNCNTINKLEDENSKLKLEFNYLLRIKNKHKIDDFNKEEHASIKRKLTINNSGNESKQNK